MRRFRNFFHNRIGAVIFFTGWFAVAANAPGLQAKRAEIRGYGDRVFVPVARRAAVEKRIGKLPRVASVAAIKSSDRLILSRTRKLLKILLKKGRYPECSDLSYQYLNIAELSKKGLLNNQREKILLKQLSFNLDYFGKEHSPRFKYATRIFRGSRLVWMYFSGYGWQIHPLSSVKRCNSFLSAGNRNEFIASLNEILRVRAPRGKSRKFLVNEYYFPWEGYRLPWISSMVEGVKLPLLAKAISIDANPRRKALYNEAIDDSLTAFETDFRSGGVSDGSWYLEYAFHNCEKVLNGFQYSLLGLAEFNRIVIVKGFDNNWGLRSKLLFDSGIVELYETLSRYDLGSRSKYSLIESPANSSYHAIHVKCLRGLAGVTDNSAARDRFLDFALRWGGKARRQ